MNSNPQTLVILRKQLGDTLLLEPALTALAAASTGPIGLVSRTAFAPMISLMAGVTALDGYQRPGRFGRVISFDPKRKASLIALASLAPERRLVVSSAKHLGALHRLVYGRHREVVRNPDGYWARYYFDRVATPAGPAFRPPVLQQPPAAWRSPLAPADYVLLHPTSAWQQKCWPQERWIDVCRDVLRDTPLQLVLSGGSSPWERDFCNAIEQGLDDRRVINMAGRTSMPEYLALLANARLVLTVDGSASHLAAAFARPMLAVFGPTNPAHWHYPTETSLRLWAGDYSAQKKPPTALIPTGDVLAQTRALLAHIS